MTKQEKGRVERRCGNCRYFQHAVNLSVCRRYPPGLLKDGSDYYPAFPDVQDDWLCGEWAAADDISLEDAAKEVLG